MNVKKRSFKCTHIHERLTQAISRHEQRDTHRDGRFSDTFETDLFDNKQTKISKEDYKEKLTALQNECANFNLLYMNEKFRSCSYMKVWMQLVKGGTLNVFVSCSIQLVMKSMP